MDKQPTYESLSFYTLPAGPNKTYGFDVRKVPSGKKYILVTENRLHESKPWRNSIVIFPDFLNEFQEMLETIKQELAQTIPEQANKQ